MGIEPDDIARVLNISRPTLLLYFDVELYQGTIDANAKVAQSLYRMATDPTKPNVVAAIFWMKARAGWRDSDSNPESKRAEAERQSKTAERDSSWQGLLN